MITATSRTARSMTGYTQATSTWPGPHASPRSQCAGYVHQSGRHTSSIDSLEHALDNRRRSTSRTVSDSCCSSRSGYMTEASYRVLGCARFARFGDCSWLPTCTRARRAAGPCFKCAKLAARPTARPAIMARRMTVMSMARRRRRASPGRPWRPPPLIALDCSPFLARDPGCWPAGLIPLGVCGVSGLKLCPVCPFRGGQVLLGHGGGLAGWTLSCLRSATARRGPRRRRGRPRPDVRVRRVPLDERRRLLRRRQRTRPRSGVLQRPS